jgi:uncharacterized membrane protein
MIDCNAAGHEPTLFSAILTPHRSLSGAGFLVLMLAVSVVSFASGLFFFVIGAWPVVGFLGLDVLLIYWAFRMSYRAAIAFEEVTVTPSELTVRNVSHRGKVREYALNPVWVRLETKAHAEFGIERLFLVSHGRRFPVAVFLGPQEKAGFAAALSAALGEARRGPTRSLAG